MARITRAKATQEPRSRKTPFKKARSDHSSGSKLDKPKNNTAALSAPAPFTPAVPPKKNRTYVKTAAQRAERNEIDARRLAAVSGVVIPSQVPPGQLPNQGRWKKDERMKHACSVCGRKFALKYHVQSHMSACVKRNGNPNGARWDDAWRDGAIQTVSMNAQPSAPQDLQMEEDQGEDDQREDEEEVDEMEDHETEDGEMEDDQSEDGQPEVRELSKLSFAWPSRVGLGQWMPSGWTWLREA